MIGYYVHHQGRGHLHRAQCVHSHLGVPMTILTSLPRPQTRLATGGASIDWVNLARDDDCAPVEDPTAGAVLHWAPLRHRGLRQRMSTIAAWIEHTAPQVVVVDVSVEVTTLCRLMGVPVIAVAMPGERTDQAHRLGYDLASALLACWPGWVRPPSWPRAWVDKTRFVGAFSRFDARRAADVRTDTADPVATQGGPHRVVLMLGAGGNTINPENIQQAIAATPGWQWDIVGGPHQPWRPDPWPALRAADVVITHAGQNAVAEVAAARVAAIIIPQPRPHGEQDATAAVLREAGLATVLPGWPRPRAWPGLLNEAALRGGQRWARWSPGDGAARAADLIKSFTTADTS